MARILIIEDDDDIRNILTQELLKEGYTVDAASDGIEGSHLLGNTPDLVLMDLMLPGLTGEGLLPMIPEEIPVIAVSARSSVDDKVELLFLHLLQLLNHLYAMLFLFYDHIHL